MNAIEGYSEVWLDSCCGHPQQHGVYHYHKYPSCVKSPFADDGQRHSPVLGFAFDGFPVHGPYEEAGVMARDLKGDRALDVCNGHTDPARGYHYHVTPGRFPYIIGGYAGVPEPSNNHMLRRVAHRGDRRQRRPLGYEGVWHSLGDSRQRVARQDARSSLVQLDPATRGGVPPGVPSWVQIGPFEASKVTRQGDTVTGRGRHPGRRAGRRLARRPHRVWRRPARAGCGCSKRTTPSGSCRERPRGNQACACS